MDPTQGQGEAAKACGCAFLPATEAQVALPSMQRRIFRIDGSPFIATRDDGAFFETHGTLAAVLSDEIRRMSSASMSADRAFLRTMAASIHLAHH